MNERAIFDPLCQVRAAILFLRDALNSGRLPRPWSRQRVAELLKLAEDIASGRGGPDHLPAMEALADRLSLEATDEPGRHMGLQVHDILRAHHEVFQSHIDTHNCATGDCVKLAPAPCQMACPAGIDVPSYVTLIGQGKDAEAIELIRRDNPFPWVCGLVCTSPCELMCVRGRLDSPIAIKSLKAFAAERTVSEHRYLNPEKAPDNGRRVCVLGAGPAGLSGAYYLALKGYRVTVIEGLPVAGGMMTVGIPRYRLPLEVIEREVAAIARLGVEFRFNTYLGVDATLDSLRDEGFEAFLVALGAHSCLSLKIPGERTYRPVISAIEFLRDVALGDKHLPGRRVAVIGGGNVAIDAARTCIRLGAEETTIVYRRTRCEMPANLEEIEQAEEEGVHFSFLVMPVCIEGQDCRVTGLKCLATELGPPDETGRQRPRPVEGSEYVVEVDAVISAVGQSVHPGGLLQASDLHWSRRGTLSVNTATMATPMEGVFAAGDQVTGPATVVEAIGGGKKAAEAIDRYLNGLPQPNMPPVPVRRARLPLIEVSADEKMNLDRPHMPLLEMNRRRITFQQVELGYPEKSVRNEARRCLRCDVCLRCGKCVSVCRDKMGVNALGMGYMDFDRPGPTDLRITAERCIGCGACAANCPTGAMAVEKRDGQWILSLCGTILNRLPLEYCRFCDAELEPARYREFVAHRTHQMAASLGGRLCESCAREQGARQQTDHSVTGPEARNRKVKP